MTYYDISEELKSRLKEMIDCLKQDRSCVNPMDLEDVIDTVEELKNLFEEKETQFNFECGVVEELATINFKTRGSNFGKYSPEQEVSDLVNTRLSTNVKDYYIEILTHFNAGKNAVTSYVDYSLQTGKDVWVACPDISGYTESPTMESVLKKINKDLDTSYLKGEIK